MRRRALIISTTASWFKTCHWGSYLSCARAMSRIRGPLAYIDIIGRTEPCISDLGA